MIGTATVRSESNGSPTGQVLIADPSDSVPGLYRDILANEGFELATAASGVECVLRLRERVPDLLVLEPQLRWGGGDGVLEIMQEFPELAGVPVLVHTACRQSTILDRIQGYSISGYYPRPMPPEQLMEKLRDLTRHPRRGLILAETARRLQSAIERRTHGGVYDLRVEFSYGRVIVYGRSDSYYSRQLAWIAVREVSQSSEVQFEKIELDIAVKWASAGSLYLK